jgi:hypothetical protein
VEIFFVVLVIVVVFCLLLGLYAFFILSITGINIFLPEKSESSEQVVRSLSDILSRERFKKKIADTISIVSRFFGDMKFQGLFVTVKLTMSFIQVLLGTLPRFHLQIDGDSSPSFIFAVDLNPMHYVPIMSECTPSDTLDRPFVHILLVLFLPATFIVMTLLVRSLVKYLMRRNSPSLLSSSVVAVDRAMFDVTLKAIVWFCLFSFPLLTSGCVTVFDL